MKKFDQRLVARERFFRTVDTIQERNKDVDTEIIQREVDLAVEWVKSEFRKNNPSTKSP